MKLNEIRLLKYEDVKKIAEFHKTYIEKGFISSLGERFLTVLYQSMNNSKYSFCLVYKEDDRFKGFVSGSVNIKKFYLEFILNHFLKIVIILFPKLLSIKFLIKILETLMYPTKKTNYKLPDAELLSIVVEQEFQGTGVSELLFLSLINEFKKRGINEFKVVVGDNLERAKRFYEKMGGVLASKIEVHKGEVSSVYVFKI